MIRLENRGRQIIGLSVYLFETGAVLLIETYAIYVYTLIRVN